MDIAAHIGRLVLEHECVIIPGLGAFLTNYHAAEINPRQHHIQPPTRKLVFNSALNTNDGLLAHYLAQRLSISYKTSLLLLEVFAGYCQRDLAEGKQIDFGDLGILDRNSHYKLEFYPNTTINYNEDAFGLKPLVIKRIDRKSDYSQHAPIRKIEVRPNTTKVIKLNSAVLRRVAAVLIPLALLIGAVFYLPSLMSNKQLYQTSVFSFMDSLKSSIFPIEKHDNKEKAVEVIETTENKIPENIDNNTDAVSVDDEAVEETITYPTEFIVQEQNPEVPQGQFHIICGSFIERERAETLVDYLKAEGFTAYVAGQSNSGTYRVSLMSFSNVEDASRQIRWVRSQGFERAWILKKSF